VNNNYYSNTVVKQYFAVVEQVDGRVKSLESNCNVLVQKKFFGGGRGREEVVALQKKLIPE
jgi:hypothetical protein